MSDIPAPTEKSTRGSIRRAVIDLVSRREAAKPVDGLYPEESDLLTALQAIVRASQSREPIPSGYRMETRDSMARIFADFDF